MFLDHIYHHKLAKTTFLADLSLAAWPRRSTFSAVIHSPRVELATIAKHKVYECHSNSSSERFKSGLRRHPMNRCH